VKRQKGLLLIGGASRNVGKTTLIARIIGHFSKNNSIIGLKIKTISDSDTYFHGKDAKKYFEKYLLEEGNQAEVNDDTGKMILSGAKRSFLLRTKSEYLAEAFQFFLSQIDESELIVCESNSLRKYVVPDLFLLIKNDNEGSMKPSAKELSNLADRFILSDGMRHNFDLNDLKIENHKWILT
jgi:hypothetical protein